MIETLQQHLTALSQPRNPERHPEAHQAARSYLAATLRSYGRECSEQAFLRDGRSGCNLLSPAASERSAKALIVAHYDTVDHSPGADDNASAVAVALELAKNHPEVAVLLPDLEEVGLLGSRHFVESGVWSGIPALVLESVGYWDEEPGSQSYPELLPVAFPSQFEQLKERAFRGDFWALLHLDSDTPLAEEVEGHLSGQILRFPLPSQLLFSPAGAGLRDFGRSDHLAFWEKGRSCLMLTDSANFRNPNYHRPSDTAATLQLPKMAELTESLSLFLGSLPERDS